jgi:hypothetical protein
MFTCRECESEINQATELCPHCGADLTAPVPGEELPAAKPTLRKILIRWSILLGILLAAIWSFLWFVVPQRQGNPAARAESSAIQALGEMRSALTDYAAVQGSGYPRQFEALGDRARRAAQLAQSGNYELQYTPGPVGADGVIHTYMLQARAGNYGYLNFFTDDSGQIHETRDNRAATSQDPPYIAPHTN